MKLPASIGCLLNKLIVSTTGKTWLLSCSLLELVIKSKIKKRLIAFKTQHPILQVSTLQFYLNGLIKLDTLLLVGL